MTNLYIDAEDQSDLAGNIEYTPTGNIAADNVQDAIDELDTEKVAIAGDSMTGALNTAYATVASHATTSAIWAAAGNIINFTGTETITDFPAATKAGSQRMLICAGATIFTHAGNITVQGGVSYTASANDKILVTAISTTTFHINILRQTETGTGSALCQ
jgi:hypothetical protein